MKQSNDHQSSSYPKEIVEIYDKALHAERNGKTGEAVKLYKTAARKDPRFRPAFMNLGAIYAKAGHTDRALDFFKHAQLISEDAAVFFNIGSELYRLKEYESAKQSLLKAIEFDQRMIRAHLLVAYICGNLKQSDDSLLYFDNVLKIEPHNRLAMLGKAVAFAESNRSEESLQLVEAYLKSNPSDAVFQSLQAGLLLKLNRTEDSYKAYRNVVQKKDSFKSFTDHLASAKASGEAEYDQMTGNIQNRIDERVERLRKRMSKRKELLQAAKEPIELKQDLTDLVDLSLLHLFQGDADKALRFLFQAKKMKEEQGS